MISVDKSGQLYWDFFKFDFNDLRDRLTDLKNNPVDNNHWITKYNDVVIRSDDGGYVRVYYKDIYRVEFAFIDYSSERYFDSVDDVFLSVINYFVNRIWEKKNA